MQGVNGMAGWQWMLIIEGIPSVVMAVRGADVAGR